MVLRSCSFFKVVLGIIGLALILNVCAVILNSKIIIRNASRTQHVKSGDSKSPIVKIYPTLSSNDSHFFTTRPKRRYLHRNDPSYQRKLPQVLGIGVKKCGTTALIRFLSLHPKVVIPNQPELHFFDMKFQKGFEYYRSLMPYTTKDEITLEKSPRYFVLPDVPSKVRQMSSSTKILLVVCDPIKRAYSDYNFEMHRYGRKLKLPDQERVSENFDEFIFALTTEMDRIKSQVPSEFSSFEDFILQSWSPTAYYLTILNTGVYSVYLKHWLKFFPMSQIHIINGEDLLNDPAKVLEETQKFLDLEVKVTEQDFYFDKTKGYFCIHPRKGMETIQCLSPSKGTTRNKNVEEMMNNTTVKSLKRFYDVYNKELFDLIGKKYDWM